MKGFKKLVVGAAVAGVMVAAALSIGYEWGFANGSSREPVSVMPGPAPAPTPIGGKTGGCVVGGCSNELCTDASQGPMMSPCIYRAEYACYKGAACERQPDGACGWTQTSALKACLRSPIPLK